MKRCIMEYMKFSPLICHPCLVRFRQGIMSEKLDTAVDTLTSLVSRSLLHSRERCVTTLKTAV